LKKRSKNLLLIAIGGRRIRTTTPPATEPGLRLDLGLKMAAILVFGACSSPEPAKSFDEASPAQKQAAAAVRLFPEGRAPGTRFSYLAKVDGFFCKTTVLDAAGARALAVNEIKYRASIQGANAITNFSCAVAESEEKCPDCWVCVQCNGNAVSY
jgi:hypothetical protein